MNDQSQASQFLYEKLLKEVGPKAARSLKNLKAACDQIEKLDGIMRISTVCEFAMQHYGSPKAQSVHNNKKIKEYVDLRIEEWNNNNKKISSHRLNEDKNVVTNKYPTVDIDVKTKVHIDMLRDTIKRLEKENEYLSQLLKHETQINPPSLADAIFAGANQDGSMEININEKPIPNIFGRTLWFEDKYLKLYLFNYIHQSIIINMLSKTRPIYPG